ncbi:MAG: hexulose-6-phosphate isomerase [Bacteroidetes bacterium GWE2_41_25]|nr:MAG: hexulose-6-phosphate isomerase [Bacteroidetes bacterium GWA2_40_15]OFX93472.1 MAG: hexulose-6-phosphate isomerase [Bacteroidetes bacterium GWE2_41_25]OFX95045.1 MAG: hexulose-6-phosphate isomerase [Bacteroidetes bacterium GWC2_40_22]OFY59956.1 MAG: hexulose-6-phosphate isomerase [Bacteroidetes bacterium GWF2_41_9]HBH84957.1 hexulose-6-phosphate isomerase [Bacteroidales bacterium]
MSTQEKLIERFLRQPKDFTYRELTRLLNGFGYIAENKGKTSGSRVIFYNREKRHSIMLHKPHPGNIMKAYAMKNVLQELETLGFIKKEN